MQYSMNEALVIIEIRFKIFHSLDPKADSKIVQLDMLWVAMVLSSLTPLLHGKGKNLFQSVATFWFHRPQGRHTYRLSHPSLNILFESGPIRTHGINSIWYQQPLEFHVNPIQQKYSTWYTVHKKMQVWMHANWYALNDQVEQEANSWVSDEWKCKQIRMFVDLNKCFDMCIWFSKVGHFLIFFNFIIYYY